MNKVIKDKPFIGVKRSIYVAASVTLLISSFWGLYFMAPSVIKGLFSLCMWVSVFSVPFVLVRDNDFSKTTNWLLCFLLIMAVFEIARSVFNTEAVMYAFGNKWFTLFGNEYTALLLLPPIYTFLGTKTYSVPLLKSATYYYIAVGILLSFLNKTPLSFLSIYAGVFFPYVKKKYKIFIGTVFFSAIVSAFFAENTARMFLVVLLFSFASYILVYIFDFRRLRHAFVLVVLITPLLIFVPMLSQSDNGTSIFQEMQEVVLDETDNSDMASDTRTFLYLEMASSLSKDNAWLIGKGAFSHYYSFYFDQSSRGKFGRISSEVPFLNYLLRGGIIYTIAYFCLIILAVYNAVWKAQNKFVQSIGIIAVGWYFNSFVGDITGCRFYHLAFFLLIGCCLSSKWLNYTDEEIKKIMTS